MKTAIINGQNLTFWNELTVLQFKQIPAFSSNNPSSSIQEVLEYYGDHRIPNYSIVHGNPPTVNLKEDGDAVMLYKGSPSLIDSFLLVKGELVSSRNMSIMSFPAIPNYTCVVRKQKLIWGEPCFLEGVFSWILEVNAMRKERTPKGWVDKDLS